MTQDNIEQLLRRADAAAGDPAPLRAGLAARVRIAAGRRRRRTRAVVIGLGVGAATAAVVAAVFLAPGGDKPQQQRAARQSVPPQPRPEAANLRAEIARLRIKIETQQAVIEHLQRSEAHYRKMAELQRILDRPDPADQMHWQVEQAAFVATYQAGRMERELGLPESAVELYRQVVRYFPNTRAAATARKRLSEIQERKGESL